MASLDSQLHDRNSTMNKSSVMNDLHVAFLSALETTAENAFGNPGDIIKKRTVEVKAPNIVLPDCYASPRLGCFYELGSDSLSIGGDINQETLALVPGTTKLHVDTSHLNNDQVHYWTPKVETCTPTHPNAHTRSLSMMLYIMDKQSYDSQNFAIYGQSSSSQITPTWNQAQLEQSQQIEASSFGEIKAPIRKRGTLNTLGWHTEIQINSATQEGQKRHHDHVVQQNRAVNKIQWTNQTAIELPKEGLITSLLDVIGEDILIDGLEDDMCSINSDVFDTPQEPIEENIASFHHDKQYLKLDTASPSANDQVNVSVTMGATISSGNQLIKPLTHSLSPHNRTYYSTLPIPSSFQTTHISPDIAHLREQNKLLQKRYLKRRKISIDKVGTTTEHCRGSKEVQEHRQVPVLKKVDCRGLQSNINSAKTQWTVQGAIDEPKNRSILDVTNEDGFVDEFSGDEHSTVSTVLDQPQDNANPIDSGIDASSAKAIRVPTFDELRCEFSPLLSLYGLTSVMTRSQKTQEMLQEWDVKNGLPRSHCCTMMHTNRSRRQLLQGQILPKWNGAPLINDVHDSNAPKRAPREQTKTT